MQELPSSDNETEMTWHIPLRTNTIDSDSLDGDIGDQAATEHARESCIYK